jgi:ABC-type bacteriocin/lantibiotic exporter with double-glycine peptidase domain
MSTLAGVYGQWHQATGASQRILTLLATPTDDDAKDAVAFVPRGGAVDIRNVSFAYTSGASHAQSANLAWVLRDLTLTLPAGSTTVLQGANGSGKSTLLHVLMRFYHPQQGQIVVDAQDIAGVTSRSYRPQVALVSQQIALVHGSVADNIRYGRIDATDKQVHAAAEQAGAADFIQRLPQGYATQIGENGVLLSGGQRQRLALARALLQGAQLILLDEPTAAADQHAVTHFKTQIAPALAGKTVLIVTHDPQLCEIAERAYQLKNGQLYSIGVAHDPIQLNVS